MGQRTYTQDAELILNEGGAMTASGVPQKNAAGIVKKVGAGRFEGIVVIDVAAMDMTSADELYRIHVQGSDTEDFSGAVQNLATVELGAAAARAGTADISVVGRYELPFQTEQADVTYDYIRLYVQIAGTTPSINFTAWVATRY